MLGSVGIARLHKSLDKPTPCDAPLLRVDKRLLLVDKVCSYSGKHKHPKAKAFVTQHASRSYALTLRATIT